MADEIRTLSHSAKTFEQVVRTHFDRPVASCRVTAGTETTNKRRITIQVIDRLSQDWADRWVVEVFIRAVSGGEPSATGNTVAFVTGTVTETLLPMAHWRAITDENGILVLDLTIAGAATRYVCSYVVGRVKESTPITWT